MRRFLRYLSSFLVLVLTVTSLTTVSMAAPEDAPPAPFYDVFGTGFANPVGQLYALGVVGGVSEHVFGVSQPVTRAQMAAFLVRATKLDQETLGADVSLFHDVTSDYWAAKPIREAAVAGYISGYQGMFRPDDGVTEAEAITMMLRALGYGSTDLTYPVGYVLKAKDVGLLADDLPFAINDTATRGWVAQALAKMIFQVDIAGTDKTLSQSRFQVAQAITVAGADYLVPGKATLTAQGVDYYGRSFPVSTKWIVESGPATITDDGLVNVTGPGVVRVTATSSNGMSVSKDFDVLQSLTANPPAISLQLGGSTTVAVDGVTAGGKHYRVAPKLQVVQGPVSIDTNDAVRATNQGTGLVRATLGTLHADIPVVIGSSLTLSPAAKVLAPGQQLQVQAFVNGNTPVDASAITWTLDGAGTISSTGLYTAAPSTQAAVITGRFGSLTASLNVSVISSLSVGTARTTMSRGQDQAFQVMGVTPDGKNLPLPDATCTVSGGIAIVGTGCHLAAVNSGQGVLTVSYGTLSTTVNLTVTGPAARLSVATDKLSVPANGRSPVTLTIQAVDANGLAVPQGSQSVVLSVSPPNLGTLDSGTVSLVNGTATVKFTPSTQVGTVTVFVGSTDGTLLSSVASFDTTLPAAAQIRLTAGPSLMQAAANTISTITATLLDTDGMPIAYNGNTTGLPITLSLSGSTSIGTLQTNALLIPLGQSSASTSFITNGLNGTLNIAGSAIIPVTSTSITTAAAGPAARLKIRPISGTVQADNSSSITVYAEEQDAAGTVRTGDSSGIVQGTLVCGTTTNNTIAGISQGVATFVLHSSVAGNCTFTASAFGMGLASDTATVTFNPGIATKLLLSVSSSATLPADGVSQANLVAKVVDANGNLVTTPSYSVTFSRLTSTTFTKPPANLTVNTVNGVATLPLTSTIYEGDDLYTAAVPGLSTVGDASTPNVTVSTRIMGVATNLALQSVSNYSPTAGDTVTVTVAVKDANGYLRLQDNSEVVTLATSGSAVVTPAQQTVNAGVATFTVRDTKAESFKLTASSGVLSAATAQIVTQPAPIANVQLVADATQLAADGQSQTNIRAQATDQFGNVLYSNFSLNLTVSNNLGTLNTTTLYGANPAIFTAGRTPGTVTISATGGNYTVAPIVLTLGTPGAPARVAVDAPATIGVSTTPTIVRVRVYDANGNVMGALTSGGDLSQIGLQIQGSGGTTTISNGGSGALINYGYVSDGVTRGAMSAVNGIASFNLTDTKVENLTLVPIAYYRGVQLQAQPATVAMVAGTPSSIKVTPNPVVYRADAGGNVTFTATVVDASGNTVVTSTPDTITVTLNSTSYIDGPTTSTFTTVNGTANISLNAKPGLYGQTTVTITSAVTGQTALVQVIGDKVPDAPGLFVQNSSGTGSTVGSWEAAKITISPTVRLVDQHIITTVNGQVVPVYTDLTFTTLLSSIPANSAGPITGYIKYTDLGAYGVRSIQVMLQTNLGVGPASLPGYVTKMQ